jgi:hypothetical protein
MKTLGLSEDLLDKYYVEMSILIDQLHTEVSDYTPKTLHAYYHLRSNATKIFGNFLEEIKALMDDVKSFDVSANVQGKLFDPDDYA